MFLRYNFIVKKKFLKKETSNCANSQSKVFVEIGCGVGNALFPLLETNPHLYFYGIDLSPRAIDFVKVW